MAVQKLVRGKTRCAHQQPRCQQHGNPTSGGLSGHGLIHQGVFQDSAKQAGDADDNHAYHAKLGQPINGWVFNPVGQVGAQGAQQLRAAVDGQPQHQPDQQTAKEQPENDGCQPVPDANRKPACQSAS